MTFKETVQLIMVLKEYYPKDVEPSKIETKAQAWHMILKDYDPNVITNAALAFVSTDTKGFMPTPGQIINKISVIRKSDNDMTEMEAWGYISKAIRNSIYNSKEEYYYLPEILRKCVTPELLRDWAMVEGDDVQTVIQSNFLRTFRVKRESIKEFEALPKSVQKFSLELAQKMALENK